MVRTWLTSAHRTDPAGRRFLVTDYREQQQITDGVIELLSATFLHERIDTQVVSDLLADLGLAEWENLVQNILPTTVQHRHGAFGEVLSAELSTAFDGLVLPVKKFRYACGKNESKQGTDQLAIRVNKDQITEVHFSEIKVRTSRRRDIAVESHKQLSDDLSEGFTEILLFVLQRLRETNNPLYPTFRAYMTSRRDQADIERFRIYLIFDPLVWTEDSLVDLDGEAILPNLSVHIVHVPQLAIVIDRVIEGVAEAGNE